MPKPVSLNPSQKQITLSAEKLRSGEIIAQRTRTVDLPSHSEIEQITNPAHVQTQISITKNMENFESMRVGVVITAPCRNEDEHKLATHEHNLKLAMQMLEKEAAEVSGEWF